MIILLGFPKSGTTSFTHLFNKLGYKSYHWVFRNNTDYIGNWIKKNKLRNQKLLSFIPINDDNDKIAVTQMDICIDSKNSYWPQISDYQQLYEENPDAVFILNIRDPKDILKSMKKWASYDKRMLKYNQELFIGLKGNDDQKILQLINIHYYNVIQFFETKKQSKFLTYHIVKDKVEKLNKYIDTKDLDFPKVNKGK